jgi:hypothetical protein
MKPYRFKLTTITASQFYRLFSTHEIASHGEHLIYLDVSSTLSTLTLSNSFPDGRCCFAARNKNSDEACRLAKHLPVVKLDYTHTNLLIMRNGQHVSAAHLELLYWDNYILMASLTESKGCGVSNHLACMFIGDGHLATITQFVRLQPTNTLSSRYSILDLACRGIAYISSHI